MKSVIDKPVSDARRLEIFRAAICLGLIVGIFLSLEFWFPVARSFPRAPFVFALPEAFLIPVERFLAVVLIASLALVMIRPRTIVFSAIAIFTLVLLTFFDQMRLQPWVYQYLLFFLGFLLCSRLEKDVPNSRLSLAFPQIIFAGLYFWSGIQKLNYTFSQETLPFLLSPFENVFSRLHLPLSVVGLSAALFESLMTCGLLFRRTRQAAVCAAMALHLVILAVLIVKNYNSVVWAWNVFSIAGVFILFWQSDTSVFRELITGIREKQWRKRLASIIAAAAFCLPVLSFWGWWDMYLSGALYSGNTETAVIKINGEVFEKLPPKAQSAVFDVKSSSLKVLPLHEWSMAELNVPVYPERRVFKQILNPICDLAANRDQIALIIKEKPQILDGTYTVTQYPCPKDQITR